METNGWLRTGHEGYLNGDGFLYIVGRIKELINRGGAKISPAEQTIDTEEIVRFCRLYLKAIEIPRRIHVVEGIPRTATNKVQRQELAKRFCQ